MLKPILFMTLLSAGIFSNSLHAKEITSSKTVQYSVSGYTIQTEFLSNEQLRWTYLQAPTNEEVGKTAIEKTDTVQIRDDVVLVAWTEKSGAQVVDVFDFSRQKVIANFIMPDGKRYQSVVKFKIINKNIK